MNLFKFLLLENSCTTKILVLIIGLIFTGTEIALRVSLILVDILRITVPTAPYSESQLKEVFKLFIRQLKGLAEISDSKFAHRFYLLERLAVVKMFVLLTEPALRAESILEDMFQTFFEVIRFV